MLGVSESRKSIKGGFAKKIIEEVARIRDSRLKKSYISNSEFDDEVDNSIRSIINGNHDKDQ